MIGTYDDIATEYYDAERHPTCANFREASKIIIKKWIRQLGAGTGTILEVGAGKSVVAELVTEDNMPLHSLMLLDSSSRMLEYSKAFIECGARRIITSADDMHILPNGATTIVSSLGDAYNTEGFWAQVEKVLVPNGTVIFTTPSYDWAASFRDLTKPDSMTSAEFELTDGRHISIPSYVFLPEVQIALMRTFGLHVEEMENIPLSALGDAKISSKLSVLQRHDGTIVAGYLAHKRI
jgi:hypothetical protein